MGLEVCTTTWLKGNILEESFSSNAVMTYVPQGKSHGDSSF
jgi:hypothetical protein